MFNESKVLEYVGMFEERKSYVTVPRVESYDAEAYVLVIVESLALLLIELYCG